MGIQPPVMSLFPFVKSKGGRKLAKEAIGNNIIGAQTCSGIGPGRQTDRWSLWPIGSNLSKKILKKYLRKNIERG